MLAIEKEATGLDANGQPTRPKPGPVKDKVALRPGITMQYKANMLSSFAWCKCPSLFSFVALLLIGEQVR